MFKPMKIGDTIINESSKTFFIADIASNHDAQLSRCIDLIHLAAQSGADAVKFQHFLADEIVSDEGFKKLGKKSHQSSWSLSVYETYKKYELNREWTETLFEESKKAGVVFLSTPYDLEAVEHLAPFVTAWKIGSGDFGWMPLLYRLKQTNKPIIMATGATEAHEIIEVINYLKSTYYYQPICLMQCNTNYNSDFENFNYINLNVLKWMKTVFPGMTLGLSDHTPGHTTVLGAVALGARIIEKHFTDDNTRHGPDHEFSMTPTTWKEMTKQTKILQMALGDGKKKVENNEKDTRIIQRRGKWIVDGVEKELRPAL